MISAQEHIKSLAFNAYHRALEVYQYQVNIDNYTAMLAVLPQDAWPVELAQFAGVKTEELPQEFDHAVIQTINDYQYRDKLRGVLRTEKVEQSKARAVFDALKSQIPVAQYDVLLAAVKNPPQTVLSPIQFKLRFTSQERVAIKAARLTDTIIDDFFDIIDDPRLQSVDLSLQSTQDAVGYLQLQDLITAERAAVILAV